MLFSPGEEKKGGIEVPKIQQSFSVNVEGATQLTNIRFCGTWK